MGLYITLWGLYVTLCSYDFMLLYARTYKDIIYNIDTSSWIVFIFVTVKESQ